MRKVHQTLYNTPRTARLFLLAVSCLLLTACGKKGDIRITKQLEQEVSINPDYKDVTIPANIAPLNFQTDLENPTCLLIEGKDSHITVHAEKGVFEIPQKAWRALLESHAGSDLKLTVCEEKDGEWQAYQSFPIHVAPEKADPYLAYRKLISCYGQWNRMGIYQRNIETYEESAIYENRLTDYNCVNCHSFPMQDPNKMLFHMRAKAVGTVLVRDGHIDKLNTKTDS
ncbi:MAG: hypothetical protein HUJ99_04630, partial [Bacteroidaceae bacterium]|nr:hypothetical protein [Bacteroidaceae bacterium]